MIIFSNHRASRSRALTEALSTQSLRPSRLHLPPSALRLSSSAAVYTSVLPYAMRGTSSSPLTHADHPHWLRTDETPVHDVRQSSVLTTRLTTSHDTRVPATKPVLVHARARLNAWFERVENSIYHRLLAGAAVVVVADRRKAEVADRRKAVAERRRVVGEPVAVAPDLSTVST